MPGENATGGGGAVRRHNATSSIEEAPSPIAESNSPPTPRRMVPTEENTESEEYSFQEKVLLFICVCIFLWIKFDSTFLFMIIAVRSKCNLKH